MPFFTMDNFLLLQPCSAINLVGFFVQIRIRFADTRCACVTRAAVTTHASAVRPPFAVEPPSISGARKVYLCFGGQVGLKFKFLISNSSLSPEMREFMRSHDDLGTPHLFRHSESFCSSNMRYSRLLACLWPKI